MNIFLLILLILAGLVALVLIVASIAPKAYSVTREITIDRPRMEIFNYARMLKNQEKYSVWVMRDPNVHIVYTGIDGTVGAKSAWRSDNKNVGVGEQEIKKIREGDSIEVEIRFEKPFRSTGFGETVLDEIAPGKTTVTNRFFGTSKYPFNAMNFMMDKMLGKDMEQNLKNLKGILER